MRSLNCWPERASAAGEGEFELYKTTHNFDGTYQHPQWLG